VLEDFCVQIAFHSDLGALAIAYGFFLNVFYSTLLFLCCENIWKLLQKFHNHGCAHPAKYSFLVDYLLFWGWLYLYSYFLVRNLASARDGQLFLFIGC
jgi:hypothetical protein